MKVLAWISLAFLIGTHIAASIADPDIWWHVAVGRWIVAHESVPTIDIWNRFGAGQPWRAYSWSNELVYALVANSYGDKGLVVLEALLAVALVISMQLVMGSLARNRFFGAIVGACVGLGCVQHFSLRPQTFVWILYGISLWLAESILRRGVSVLRLIALAAVGCAWANSHLSAIIGVIGLFLWSLDLNAKGKSHRTVLLVVACFMVGTLFTPYLGGEWLTLIAKSDHIMRFSGIEEFKPANIIDSAAGFLLIQLALLLVLFFRSQRLPAPGQFILVLFSAFAGLAAVKFLPFAIITAAALLVVWWRDEIRPSQSKIVEGLDLLQSKFMRLQSGTIGAIAFMLGCFAWINGYQLLMRPVNFEATPKRAVDFIEQTKAEHPVLNGFDSGGYLIYRWSSVEGVPEHLVALDGRTNVNPPDVWRSYLSALNGDERWHSFIDKVGAKTILWRMKTPLVSLLLESPNWCRVFQSGSSVRDYAVFISREQFDLRRGEFQSSDCQ